MTAGRAASLWLPLPMNAFLFVTADAMWLVCRRAVAVRYADMRLRSTILPVVLALSLLPFYISPAVAQIALPEQSVSPIVIDRTSPGRIFDGVGAISGGGGNSRLLFDYPEPQRSQILDYLFKPNYGASLQIFKVEIGGDMDSTDGAESSHQHTSSDENYDRGYEWWLLEQAKLRNPNIKLAALAWGAPHWVGNGEYWSKDMIEYTIRWLKHAKSDHHLTIDYVGGRNEKQYNLDWYKQFKAALIANGLGSIQVIASDDWPKVTAWNIAHEMTKDAEVNKAIDIIGVHGPGWAGYPPADALALNKPLWDSESHFDENPPYNEMARNINRNYAAGKVTATIYWPVVSAIYDNLPYDDIGLIKSNQPWSGHYTLTPSLWVMAQTTQFTRPGWRYIDSASGFVTGDTTGAHGSYVALESPGGKDFSVIIETVETKTTGRVQFQLKGFHATALHLWSTFPGSNQGSNRASANQADWFARQADVPVVGGKFSLSIEPGHVYTLTTTTGQTKGNIAAPPAGAFPFPFADNFDSYAEGKLARYFSDIYGGFETIRCAGGRGGICLRQVVPAEPTAWKKSSNRPFTIVGSLDWSDYRVSSDVLFEEPGAADLIGRLTGMSDPDVPNAYVLRLADDGAWSVIKSSAKRENADEMQHPVLLASGKVAAPGLKTWHRLSLAFHGKQIIASIDGDQVTAVEDESYPKGMVGIGTLGYIHAQFDNFEVNPD